GTWGLVFYIVLVGILAFDARLVDEAFLSGQLVTEVVEQAALVEASLVAFIIYGELVLVMRSDDTEGRDRVGDRVCIGLRGARQTKGECCFGDAGQLHDDFLGN